MEEAAFSAIIKIIGENKKTVCKVNIFFPNTFHFPFSHSFIFLTPSLFYLSSSPSSWGAPATLLSCNLIHLVMAQDQYPFSLASGGTVLYLPVLKVGCFGQQGLPWTCSLTQMWELISHLHNCRCLQGQRSFSHGERKCCFGPWAGKTSGSIPWW